MFPISSLGVASLALSAVFLCGCFSGRRRRRLALYVLAVIITVTTVIFLIDFRNEYAGLGVLILSGLAILALALGEGWRWLAKLFLGGHRLFIPLLIAPTLVYSGWFLYRQYVPAACLDAALPITISGTEFRVQAADTPIIRWAPDDQDETWLFLTNNMERKEKTAQTCRLSRNGTRPIPVLRAHLGAKRVSGNACRDGLCLTLRQPADFVLEQINGTDPVAPSYWFDSGAPEVVLSSGNNSEGALCVLPEYRPNTLHCMRWVTPAPNIRAIASTDQPPGKEPEALKKQLGDELDNWLKRIAK